MQKLAQNRAISLLLIGCLVLFTFGPALAGSQKLPVLLTAMQIENVPEEVRKRIEERWENLFNAEPTLQVTQDPERSSGLTSSLQTNGGTDGQWPELARLAEGRNVAYIYGGHLANNSTNPERVLLVGEFWRYDRTSGLRHTFEILKYYENFGVELLKFRNEFIRTVVAEHKTGPKILPYLVLAGIAVAGIATFAIVGAEGGTTGGGGQGSVTP